MSLECKRSVPELPLFCFQAADSFFFFATQGLNKKKEVEELRGLENVLSYIRTEKRKKGTG